MMTEPDDLFWDFDPPDHNEARGDFPDHPPLSHVQEILTGEQAAELAARRLREWEREHGD